MPGDRLREAVMALPTWDKRSVPGGIHVKRSEVLAAIEEEAAALDVWDVAVALHETARRDHNLGEGFQRAICDSIMAHEERAMAILAALRSGVSAARDRVGTEEPGQTAHEGDAGTCPTCGRRECIGRLQYEDCAVAR